MSIINFGHSVSLKEFAHAISTVGDKVTIIGQGEPGMGKSAVLQEIARLKPGYQFVYIDCTRLLDQGDLATPYTETIDIVDGKMRVTKVAPQEFFKFHTGKPVIAMLDEIGKAHRGVVNALLTLMLEKRYGEFFLPEGSIVCGSTNLASDGVNDRLEAHVRNRVAFITVRKPDADEWIEWAMNNGIDPTVIAWAKQFPQAFASYTDPAQRDNQYIFNPTRAGVTAFVTPRSLEKASHIAKQRDTLGDALTISLLAGTIGESAARDMQAFFTVVDKLPTWDNVVKNPETAKLPDDTIARCILVFGAITRVEKDTLSSFMKYVQRMDKEWQALFATSVMKSPQKQVFCVSNKDFKDWALANQWLF